MLLVSPVLFIGPFSAQLNTQNFSPPHLDHMGLPFVELLCPATHVLSPVVKLLYNPMKYQLQI